MLDAVVLVVGVAEFDVVDGSEVEELEGGTEEVTEEVEAACVASVAAGRTILEAADAYRLGERSHDLLAQRAEP